MSTITGPDIERFRLLALRAALKLEMYGLASRGPSAYTRLKYELDITGSHAAVFDKVTALLFDVNTVTNTKEAAGVKIE